MCALELVFRQVKLFSLLQEWWELFAFSTVIFFFFYTSSNFSHLVSKVYNWTLVLADKQNMVDHLVARVNFKVSTVTPQGAWEASAYWGA